MHIQRKFFAVLSSLFLAIALTSCSPASAFDSPEDELAFSELQKDFEYRPLDFLDEAHVWLGKEGFEELESQITQALESEVGSGNGLRDYERAMNWLEIYEGRVYWQGYSTARANMQSTLKNKSVAEQVSEIIDDATYGTCDTTFSEASSLIEATTWKPAFEELVRLELKLLGQVCTEYWADYFLDMQASGIDILTVEWVNIFAKWDPEGVLAGEFLKTYAENLN